MLTRHRDGTCHFSHVKKIELSPAHYVSCVAEEVEATRAMRIGTIVHFLLLGARVGAWVLKGDFKDRHAKGWKKFESSTTDRILAENEHAQITLATSEEWELCEEIAAKFRAHPVVVGEGYLAKGNLFEVPLKWEDAGISCSTSGVDIVAPADYFSELKTTSSVQPYPWMRQAERMTYHAQIAWYERGLRANGHTFKRPPVIVGIEINKPFDVVALRVEPTTLAKGHALVTKWLERLRASELEEHFPGYAQAPIPWEMPDAAWSDGDELADEQDAEEGAAA